jgi:oligopeptide transport system substrate-binding protein
MPATKILRLVAFVLAVSLLATACSTHAARSEFFGKIEPPEGQVLRYISGSEPESIDPQMSSGQPEARLHLAIFEGLTEYHPKTMEAMPAIAERWVIDEDATEITFFLRKNARYSNGEPITAHDFSWSWRRGLDPALASRSAYLAYDIKYAQAYNEGSAFVRDPATGRFLLASEAATANPDEEEQTTDATLTTSPAEGASTEQSQEARHQAELAKEGEASAPDTPFHRQIHEPMRLVVPGDEKGRQTAVKDNPKLAQLLQGKEFVPVKPEDIGIEAVDDHTLRVTLMQPAPYFLGLVPHQFFRAFPRKVVEKFGTAWTRPENIVCSGPFKLESHRPYNEIVVVKNPQYWDAATVRLERIKFYPLEDQTTMLNLYKSGEVDATYNHTVPASWLKSGVRHAKDYMDAPENAIEYYQINTTKPPMNDVRVRKAFSLAIDREALADYRVVAKPLRSFTPEGIFRGYPRLQGTEFNPERAKQLLAEAGYRDASGKFDPKKFPIDQVQLTYNTSESNRQVAEFVQAQWKQNLGLTVPLNNVEWKTFLNMRSKLEYKGFARSGWVGDYMDPNTFLALFYTRSGDNGTGWFDPRYAALLREANSEPDQAKRYAILARAEAMLLDVAPVVPLVTPATSWMKKPYVKGMYPNPGTLHAWKYVYIEHDRAKWDRQMPDMSSDQLAAKE